MPTEIIWLIGILVGIFVLILSREIACWYFKINERIELMKEQNSLLQSIAGASQPDDESDEDSEVDKPIRPPLRNPLTR